MVQGVGGRVFSVIFKAKGLRVSEASQEYKSKANGTRVLEASQEHKSKAQKRFRVLADKFLVS